MPTNLDRNSPPVPHSSPARKYLIQARARGAITQRVLLLFLGGVLSGLADDRSALFENKIRPLLVKRCLECHGAEKQKGGLRLDTREGWLKGGDSGPALVPGEV